MNASYYKNAIHTTVNSTSNRRIQSHRSQNKYSSRRLEETHSYFDFLFVLVLFLHTTAIDINKILTVIFCELSIVNFPEGNLRNTMFPKQKLQFHYISFLNSTCRVHIRPTHTVSPNLLCNRYIAGRQIIPCRPEMTKMTKRLHRQHK